MKTTVIHIRDRQPGDVYIGRRRAGEDGYFGNPYPLGKGMPRGSSISNYRAYFLKRLEEDAEFKARVRALKGKRLVCFCKPHPCHGDVIAEWVDGDEGDDGRSVTMPIDPRMDGVTHVNVYSKGATSIGRFLSNFAHAPFSLPEHGTFASLEGYWYWLSVEDDRLRHLYGYQAKKLGQDIRRRHSGGQRGDFKDLILEAIRAKLRAHRDRWPELAATGDLPLLHYYVFNGKVKDVTAGNQWQLDEIARIRTILIDRARGD